MHLELYLELTKLRSEFSMYIFFFPSEFFLLMLVVISFKTKSNIRAIGVTLLQFHIS